MKTAQRIKDLKGTDELQDKVVESVLEAYYYFRREDEIETIDATLAIINEYKEMTSVFCANCTKPHFCEDCMPMKKRNMFEKVEEVLFDQKENLPEIYR
ncbi:MAG: hypothetical protein JEZ05_02600 [Tenericutes bacterium]|nr:hypothetical protein [Mycoplasmatota bacterium]